MNKPVNNLELAYEMQRENFSKSDTESILIQKTWFDESTVDHWRHHRMMAPLQVLLQHFPNSKWLTVGDGRFGLDSIRLKKMQPSLYILPTDISTTLLIQAKEMGVITDFREENAETLSFADDSFDFAFCKEAYHHFPRPYIALYEMLRVAKTGIVFIEPNDRRDRMIPERMMNLVKRTIKKMIGKPILHQDTWNFEVSGNYVYMLSKNEMEKIALGMQLPTVAFNYYNDYYEQGVEFEKAVPGNRVFEKVKKDIARQDRLCKLGLQTYKDIIAILFKESPDAELRNKLKAADFEIIDLPENPYVKIKKEESAKK